MLPHYAQLTFPHPRPCVTNPAGAGSPHSHQIHIPPHFYFPPPASFFHAAQLWPGSSQHLLGMSAVLLPSAFEGLHVARSALDASLGSLPPRLGLRAASHGNAVHGGRGHVARVAEAVTKGASCRILAVRRVLQASDLCPSSPSARPPRQYCKLHSESKNMLHPSSLRSGARPYVAALAVHATFSRPPPPTPDPQARVTQAALSIFLLTFYAA